MVKPMHELKAVSHSSKTSIYEDSWEHPKLLKTGKTDGFKWYIGEYYLPSFIGVEFKPYAMRLAYVDVSGTKLDGVVDTRVVDKLGVNLYCGCTFAGSGESSSLLRSIDGSLDRWYVGEDYGHDYGHDYGQSQTPSSDLSAIELHIENETIPSIVKALVELDIKNPNFNGTTLVW